MPGKVAEAPALEAIAFIDLEAQRQRLGGRTATAISRVLGHGKFIMGPEVAELETELAEFTGRRHAITCASGTDALILPLMAKGIGPGDAVFVPAFTFAATAEAVAQVGATPVFVDVRAETFNLDPESLSAALSVAQENGLTPRAAIAVDLFGQPADYGAINAIASAADLWVLADAAQSFGSSLGGVRAGSLGDIDATSFFPSKPLGCYGDGGAVFTDDDDKAALIRSIRVHGSGENKYDAARIGLNSRLDTLQAAILLQKLAIFDDEIRQRQVVAERYRERLGKVVTTPHVRDPLESAWAQYTIRSDRRGDIATHLRGKGIPTAIYYPKPLHQQTAYRDYPVAPGGAPISEELSRTVLSLPMHPYLEEAVQDRIVGAVRDALARVSSIGQE